ncbi:MAG: DUF2332 domain-containing protein [Rhodospirillaceae bacterium]|nr:DUF2332 domain-containing protein [Rhodospirillaceae bacterium]
MTLSPAETERAVSMFQLQRDYSVKSNAPTYAGILDGCIADVRAGGPVSSIVAHWDGVLESVFALRMLAALHRLALDGKAPKLAGLFLTCGGKQAPEQAWPAARELIAEHADYIVAYCGRAPQTNETARSGVLLGGFLTIAAEYPFPLRLREIGASAGLNLMWDQYRVTTPAFTWGRSDARLELSAQWQGELPPLKAPITISDRAACDRDLIDIHKADDRTRLESYIWPDQPHRMKRLRTACAIALDTPFRLDQADAAEWIERELRNLPEGQTTAVYHSIFRQYLPPAADRKLEDVMTRAGARATGKAPLAWLAMEVPRADAYPDLTLTMWPGGERRKLATAHYHGDWIKWL